MANICNNTLTVMKDGEDGSDEQFQAFKDQINSGFNSETEEYQLLSSTYPIEDTATDPAQWADEHWGTKTDVLASVDDIENDEAIEFFFESNWTPPLKWMEHMTQQFPHLIFKLQYDEPGEAFMGVAAGVSGDFRHAMVEYF